MADVSELRRKAEQFARLAQGIYDQQMHQLLASLAEEFTREADRLEAIAKTERGEVILFRGEISLSLRVPSQTSIM